MNHLIKLIDVLPKGCDTLCSTLMSTVIDYPQQVTDCSSFSLGRCSAINEFVESFFIELGTDDCGWIERFELYGSIEKI